MRLPLVLLLAAACRTAPPASDIGEAPPPREPVEDVADTDPAQDGRSLILVSLDGFRADYLDHHPTPNLDRIAAGVRAASLQPPFPSYTFPSHYTIVTGLHPESHGIVSNVFWDPVRQEQFKLGAPEDMTDGTWWGGEPLWNTAEKQGMRAATLFWPGSEADIGGMRPSDWTAYDSKMTHHDRVEQVLTWLARPDAERPGFITLYFSAVDSAGHDQGPSSPELARAVIDVDGSMGALLDGIDQAGLSDQVDVVVVSDHGMYDRSPDRAVPVDDALLEGTRIVEWGPVLAVDAEPERAAQIASSIDALDHVQCALREATPEAWHYRKHRAIADVVCLADVGWMVGRRADLQNQPYRLTGATHGWDPSDARMQGIFLANGPRFRDGVRIDTLHAVDVYGVLTRALGLEPAPNEGDAGRIGEIVEGR